MGRQEKEGTDEMAFQKHSHCFITEAMAVFQDRARTQQGYFYTSLKFMYNPTEICGFRPSTDLHLNASLEEKEWCYLWNYSGLPLALALNSTAPAPRAYLATKNQPEGPNQFIRANKQFKASSS